jgi:hypothetical protein
LNPHAADQIQSPKSAGNGPMRVPTFVVCAVMLDQPSTAPYARAETTASTNEAGAPPVSTLVTELHDNERDIVNYELKAFNTPSSVSPKRGRSPDREPPSACDKAKKFWRQFAALMVKNFTLKKRSKMQTFCELLAPVILLSVLSFGWVLSLKTVKNVPAQIYANDTSLLTSVFSQVSNAQCSSLFSSGFSASSTSNVSISVGSGGISTGGSAGCIPTNLLFQLSSYDGPLPVPSFDMFVNLSLTIQGILNQSADFASTLSRLQIASSQYDSLVYLGKLSFAPNTPAVQELVAGLNQSSTYFHKVFHNIYDSEQDALNDALSVKGNSDRTWALIYFNSLNISAGQVNFKIRMNYTTVPSTNTLYFRYQYTLNTGFLNYILSGFMSIESFISDYILTKAANSTNSTSSPEVSYASFTAAPFPTRELNNYNTFYDQVGSLVGFFMCMSMLYPVSRLLKAVVEEKENRSRETMKIMGMRGSAFVASWFVTYFLMFLVISILATLLLTRTFVFYSNKVIIFLFIFFFIISLLPFAFMVSVFFDKAKLAAIVGPVLLFAFVIPRYAFFTASSGQAVTSKKAACILSPTAFAFGADLLMTYEGAQVGMQWGDLNSDDLSFGFLMGQLLIDFFLYSFLAWYLDNVVPGEFGSKRPVYFLFQPSYWGFKAKLPQRRRSSMRAYLKRRESVEEAIEQSQGHGIVEHVGAELSNKAVVEITDLRKVFIQGMGYYKKEVVAVKGLNLTMYEGQITCLLGHNGAGKSRFSEFNSFPSYQSFQVQPFQ